MDKKEKLNIQTLKEFNNEIMNGYYFRKEQQQKEIQYQKDKIKEFKTQIEQARDNIKTLKNSVPKTLREYKSNNTYEEWVKKIRKDKDNYIIVENKDSIKIK